jgi:hypothetical protein
VNEKTRTHKLESGEGGSGQDTEIIQARKRRPPSVERNGGTCQDTERIRVSEQRENRIRIHDVMTQQERTDVILSGDSFEFESIPNKVIQLTQNDGNAIVHNLIISFVFPLPSRIAECAL